MLEATILPALQRCRERRVRAGRFRIARQAFNDVPVNDCTLGELTLAENSVATANCGHNVRRDTEQVQSSRHDPDCF
jgi:hypothetical protein